MPTYTYLSDGLETIKENFSGINKKDISIFRLAMMSFLNSRMGFEWHSWFKKLTQHINDHVNVRFKQK